MPQALLTKESHLSWRTLEGLSCSSSAGGHNSGEHCDSLVFPGHIFVPGSQFFWPLSKKIASNTCEVLVSPAVSIQAKWSKPIYFPLDISFSAPTFSSFSTKMANLRTGLKRLSSGNYFQRLYCWPKSPPHARYQRHAFPFIDCICTQELLHYVSTLLFATAEVDGPYDIQFKAKYTWSRRTILSFCEK